MLAILPLGMLGTGQIILIVVLIIVLFGGKKIPELMRGMGRGMREFKDAVNKDYSNEPLFGDDDDPVPPASTAPKKPAAAKTTAAKKPAAKSTTTKAKTTGKA